MSSMRTKVTDDDLINIHDELCQLFGRVALSPLEVAYLCEWPAAGIPMEAVRRGFRYIRDHKYASSRYKFPLRELEKQVALEYEELKDVWRGRHWNCATVKKDETDKPSSSPSTPGDGSS